MIYDNLLNIFQIAKFLFEYETPRVVTIHHIPLGILRLVLQTSVFAFVLLYQLWYSKGYQSFDIVASSVTTKVIEFLITFKTITIQT